MFLNLGTNRRTSAQVQKCSDVVHTWLAALTGGLPGKTYNVYMPSYVPLLCQGAMTVKGREITIVHDMPMTRAESQLQLY